MMSGPHNRGGRHGLVTRRDVEAWVAGRKVASHPGCFFWTGTERMALEKLERFVVCGYPDTASPVALCCYSQVTVLIGYGPCT